MATTHPPFLCHRLLVAGSLGASLLLTGSVCAQSPPVDRGEYLEQVRRMTEVAAQKRETEVRAALREAQRIGQADPGQAAEHLKKVLVDLTDDTVLSPDLQQ